MKSSFVPEEVDTIENAAYNAGVVVGRLEVIKIIKDLHEQGLAKHRHTSLGTLVWTKSLLELIDDLKSPR